MTKSFSMRWVIALKAEAKEIIKQYDLISFDHEGPFPVYKNKSQDIWLTISGIGQINSSAATMHLFHKSNAKPWSVWINLGIAGYEATYGSIYQIDKIIADNNNMIYYPSRTLVSKIPYTTLLTLDKPRTNYTDKCMLDMEGSAFYQVANKITSHELILVLKIVSDNSDYNVKNINSTKIERLVNQNFSKINDTLIGYHKLSSEETKRHTLSKNYQKVISNFHFTVSQKNTLNDLTKKWDAAFNGSNLMDEIKRCKDAKSILKKLNTIINNNMIDWEKN